MQSRIIVLAAGLWHNVCAYVGIGRPRRIEPVTDRASLQRFLETRASFIAQTSLYGYLRTRAGMRYPELFDDDRFVSSINIAKWHIWLACLSDLSIYAGGRIVADTHAPAAQVAELMCSALAEILERTGIPKDAGPEFAEHGERVRARLALCGWQGIADDETVFTESPVALVRWSPIIDELKRLDEQIVRNSIRFRWQEVRQDLRRLLNARAVLASASLDAAPHTTRSREP